MGDEKLKKQVESEARMSNTTTSSTNPSLASQHTAQNENTCDGRRTNKEDVRTNNSNVENVM